MSGIGGNKKRSIDTQDRVDWILDRIKVGMSKPEIIRQIENRYDLSTTQSRIWYYKANDSLISTDKDQRVRVKSSMLEVIHAQIIGLQQDLARVTAEIQACELARETRARIQAQLVDADDREQLKRELAAIRTIKPRYYIDCISQRSRLRSCVVKCVVEISRLHSLYVEELPILRAIQIMANSELIPAATASGLLSLLSDLEFSIDSLRPVTVKTTDLN